MANNLLKLALVVVAAVAVLYLINSFSVSASVGNASVTLSGKEGMEAHAYADNTTPDTSQAPANLPANVVGEGCYPKDQLLSEDLLPEDESSMWAQLNPNGRDMLANKNFLTAGWATGINTVGESLKNANTGLRSEYPNPRTPVSIWQNSSYEADLLRRPLE